MTMLEYRVHDRVGWESRLPVPGDPKVSMVVAAFRRPRQILVCLHSFLVQTHQNFEIIVVHNGPGREVRDVVLGVGDRRIQFHETPEEAVAALHGHKSREYGTQLAKGAWIGQTNDDNYYAPVYFEWMLSELLRHEAQFALCNMIHSHYAWSPFETHPVSCGIDAGGWICRADIVKRTPWPSIDHVTSDGEYAEALARQCRIVKVPGCLFMHN